jgi:hypothetical protein
MSLLVAGALPSIFAGLRQKPVLQQILTTTNVPTPSFSAILNSGRAQHACPTKALLARLQGKLSFLLSFTRTITEKEMANSGALERAHTRQGSGIPGRVINLDRARAGMETRLTTWSGCCRLVTRWQTRSSSKWTRSAGRPSRPQRRSCRWSGEPDRAPAGHHRVVAAT